MKKKTIAILLVLVIGMVGVFADDGDAPGAYDTTKTITLNADIQERSVLMITKAQYSDYTDYSTASSEDNQAVLTHTVSKSGVIDGVGYLTIFSNLRTGYKISYEATALKDSTGDKDRYINYSIQIGADGAEGTPNATFKTTNGATSASAVIADVSSQTKVDVFSELITINISEDFDTAVAGSNYQGTIVFTYTAG